MAATKKNQVSKIRKYYDQKVDKWGADCRASMQDGILLNLEIKTLLKYIKPKCKILDVGCANGYTDFELAKKRDIDITGVDYSKEMVESAKTQRKHISKKLKGKVKFLHGNVLNLKFKPEDFDVILSKRCITNIPGWKNQKKALTQVTKVLKKNGQLLISEPTKQGLSKMNSLRKKMGLFEIPEPWHNFYFDEDKLLKFMDSFYELEEINHFSSMYYIGSRVVQPVLLEEGEEPSYDAPINQIFSKLPNFGDYGTQRLFIFRKKEG